MLQDWEQRRLAKSLIDSAEGFYFRDAADTAII
jgi:ribosomal protein S6